MHIKGLLDEDFVNYKKPSMFIIFPYCDFKCDKENGNQFCQNWELSKQPAIEHDTAAIVERYMSNPITKAVVCGGLEPMCTFDELLDFVGKLRERADDDIVIYTGYYPEEIPQQLEALRRYKNIIVKFGRFHPNDKKHYDETLGVFLASNNQYAINISEVNMKIKTIDDKQKAAEIQQAVKDNDGYCPCRLQHTPETKCMCQEFREQIAHGIPGNCHCGLYTAYYSEKGTK